MQAEDILKERHHAPALLQQQGSALPLSSDRFITSTDLLPGFHTSKLVSHGYDFGIDEDDDTFFGASPPPPAQPELIATNYDQDIYNELSTMTFGITQRAHTTSDYETFSSTYSQFPEISCYGSPHAKPYSRPASRRHTPNCPPAIQLLSCDPVSLDASRRRSHSASSVRVEGAAKLADSLSPPSMSKSLRRRASTLAVGYQRSQSKGTRSRHSSNASLRSNTSIRSTEGEIMSPVVVSPVLVSTAELPETKFVSSGYSPVIQAKLPLPSNTRARTSQAEDSLEELADVDLDDITVATLKRLLKRLGKETRGKKVELIERLKGEIDKKLSRPKIVEPLPAANPPPIEYSPIEYPTIEYPTVTPPSYYGSMNPLLSPPNAYVPNEMGGMNGLGDMDLNMWLMMLEQVIAEGGLDSDALGL